MKRRRPVGVLSLSPSACRRLEAIRDRVIHGCGTNEPFIAEDIAKVIGETGREPVALHWRRPLSIAEINQMAPTPEVIKRPGRA
jgi:hypothetical protein